LYSFKDENGYLNLKIQKADGRKKEITSFTSLNEAKNALFRITAHYNLCQKLTGLYETKNECFQHKIKECNGACVGKESPEVYNERFLEFIDESNFEHNNMILIDRGRNVNERSAILIENGIYKGYCFYDLNYQITNIDILKTILIPMKNNRDTKNIIQSYLRKSKTIKVIKI
jgi:DNA polymerase-3 subunit epsilon